MNKAIWQIGKTVYSTSEDMADRYETGEKFYRVHSFTTAAAAEQLCGFSDAGFALSWSDGCPEWVNNPAGKLEAQNGR